MIQVDNVSGMPALKINFGNAPILLIKAKEGFVGCSYLSVETANKIGDAIAIVSGVSSFEDVLNAKVIKASRKAVELGIKPGISGKEALKILNGTELW